MKISFTGIPLAIHGTDNVFDTSSFTDLQKWAEAELKIWNWIKYSKSLQRGERFFEAIYTAIIEEPLRELIKLCTQGALGDETESFTKSIRSYKQFSHDLRIPYSNSALGRYIIEYAESECNTTATFMLVLSITFSEKTNTSLETNTVNKIREFSLPNSRFTEQWNSLEPFRNNALRLLSRFEILHSDKKYDAELKWFKSQKEGIAEARRTAEVLKAHFQDWVGKTQGKIDNEIDSGRVKAEEKISKSLKNVLAGTLEDQKKAKKSHADIKAELLSARDAVIAQVEFDETVKYWDDKETQHETARDKWMKGLGWAVFLTFIAPILFALSSNEFYAKADLIFNSIHPAKLALSIVAISLGSFCIRFASQQYSTENHLYLEAIERQTMIKTYIGLMTNGKLSEHEDRKFALDTLFRPSKTGLVTDHGSIMPTESIVKIIERQARPTS